MDMLNMTQHIKATRKCHYGEGVYVDAQHNSAHQSHGEMPFSAIRMGTIKTKYSLKKKSLHIEVFFIPIYPFPEWHCGIAGTQECS